MKTQTLEPMLSAQDRQTDVLTRARDACLLSRSDTAAATNLAASAHSHAASVSPIIEYAELMYSMAYKLGCRLSGVHQCST